MNYHVVGGDSAFCEKSPPKNLVMGLVMSGFLKLFLLQYVPHKKVINSSTSQYVKAGASGNLDIYLPQKV